MEKKILRGNKILQKSDVVKHQSGKFSIFSLDCLMYPLQFNAFEFAWPFYRTHKETCLRDDSIKKIFIHFRQKIPDVGIFEWSTISELHITKSSDVVLLRLFKFGIYLLRPSGSFGIAMYLLV